MHVRQSLPAERMAAPKNTTLYSTKTEQTKPVGSWMGDIWESLVKSVKRCLKVIVKDKLFTAEVESIINQRPIVPVSDDVNVFEALKTNHFIIGSDCYNFSPGVFKARNQPSTEMALGPGRNKPILGQVETRIPVHVKCS